MTDYRLKKLQQEIARLLDRAATAIDQAQADRAPAISPLDGEQESQEVAIDDSIDRRGSRS